MNRERAVKAIGHVTDFLVNCGCLPAYKETRDELSEAEETLTQQMNRLFTGVANRMIATLRDLGYIPQDPVRRVAFVMEMLGHLIDELPRVVAQSAVENAEAGRLIAFQDLKDFGLSLSFTTFDRWTLERIQTKIYQFSEDTARRIIGDMAANLAKSYEEGLGIDDAATRLRAEFSDIRNHRLRTIARTEIQTAQNEGIMETLREMNIRYKQWLTARDHRVRRTPPDKADHVVLHGQVVKLEERFSNGLLFPGDRLGPIAEWINCRCRIRPYIPRRNELIVSTPYYP